MSKEFGYPQYDENGVKRLTSAGDAENDMIIYIAFYLIKAG